MQAIIPNIAKRKIDTIDSLVSQIKKDKNYRNMVRFANQYYQVKAYKIQRLKPSEVKETLNQVNMAYQVMDKQQQLIKGKGKKKYMWVVNQLKLFVWLLMAYSFINQVGIVDYTTKDWSFFEQIFAEKSFDYLEFQSKLFFKNFKGNSQKWDREQEDLLRQIINGQQVKGRWNEVSKSLYFNSNKKYYRQPQRCRQHWFNHLDPDIKRVTWSQYQDLQLVQILKQCGFKWSIVTKHFKGTRTEHMVKNRAKYLFKKYGKEEQHQQESSKKLLKKMQKHLKHLIQIKNNPKIREQQDSDVQHSNPESSKKQYSNNMQIQQKKQKPKKKTKQKLQDKQKQKQKPKSKESLQQYSSSPFKKKKRIEFEDQFHYDKDNEVKIQFNEQLADNYSKANNNWEIKNQNKKDQIFLNSSFFQGKIFNNISPMQIPKNNFIKNQVYFITAPMNQSIPFNPPFPFSPFQHDFSALQAKTQINNQRSNQMNNQINSQMNSQIPNPVNLSPGVSKLHPPMFKRMPSTQFFSKTQETLQKGQKLGCMQNELPNQLDTIKDEFGIIQEYESQEEQINLNLDQIKFNHERDGGKMRQRITHELQALFNNLSQQEQKQDDSEF